MEQFTVENKVFFQFNNLKNSSITHFISTKKGWKNGNNSRFTGDSPTSYEAFRNELSSALKIEQQHLVFPRQVHGNHVVVIKKPMKTPDIPETDALVTNQRGLCLCVQTADCVPILLFDPKQEVIAAVHAGWRGTVSKLVAKTIQTMQDQFNSSPKDLIGAIGPSIHVKNYEVGEDVISKVQENFTNHRLLLKPSNNQNKACFDLWEANKSIMIEAGIFEKNIETLGLCSYKNDSLFYSARRDGLNTGRMATGIMLLNHLAI